MKCYQKAAAVAGGHDKLMNIRQQLYNSASTEHLALNSLLVLMCH